MNVTPPALPVAVQVETIEWLLAKAKPVKAKRPIESYLIAGVIAVAIPAVAILIASAASVKVPPPPVRIATETVAPVKAVTPKKVETKKDDMDFIFNSDIARKGGEVTAAASACGYTFGHGAETYYPRLPVNYRNAGRSDLISRYDAAGSAFRAKYANDPVKACADVRSYWFVWGPTK